MAKKDKKDKSAKIPKKVAGVKVPKKVRKLGKQAIRIAKDPAVSETAAAALLAAAAAIKDGKDPKATLRAAVGAVSDRGREATREAGRLSEVLKGLALDIARRGYEAWQESGRSPSEQEPSAPHERGAASDGDDNPAPHLARQRPKRASAKAD